MTQFDCTPYVGKLEHAATLFRDGDHSNATTMLNEIFSLPSPPVVEVALAILNSMPSLTDPYIVAKTSGADLTPLRQQLSHKVHSQFLAARVLKHALVRDWSQHWCNSGVDVVSFIENYLQSNAVLLMDKGCTGVLSEMSDAWAIVWKLRWNTIHHAEENQTQREGAFANATKEDVVSAVAQRLVSSFSGQVPTSNSRVEAETYVYREVARCAIEEFGLSHPRSQGRGILRADHDSCRLSFAEIAIFPIFREALCSLNRELNNENTSLLSEPCVFSTLRVVYSVLCWRYSDDCCVLGAVSEDVNDKVPEVLDVRGENWRQLLLEQFGQTSSLPFAVVESALRAYHGLTEKQHLVVEILVQLCSVTGNSWQPFERARYGEFCAAQLFQQTQRVINMFDGSSACLDILLTCSNGYRRLTNCMGTKSGMLVHPRLTDVLLVPLHNLTQAIIERLRETPDDEEMAETLDNLLQAWQTLVLQGVNDVSACAEMEREGSDAPRKISEASSSLVKVFVTSILRHHFDTSQQQKSMRTPGEEAQPESTHAEEYANSRTELIAILGRTDADGICSFLRSSLQAIRTQYIDALQRRQAPTHSLHEAAWYTVTVIAHFVADSDESERPCIPNAILSLALANERRYPDNSALQETNSSFFALVQEVLHFVKQLVPFMPSGMVSPGVAESFLFFFRRYSSSYLFPDEALHADFSNVFLTAFNGGVTIAEFCLNYVAACLRCFYHDPDVPKTLCETLSSFYGKPIDFSQWCVKQDVFLFFKQAVMGQIPDIGFRIPPATIGKLCWFLVAVCPQLEIDQRVLSDIGPCYQRIVAAAANASPQGPSTDYSLLIAVVEAQTGFYDALRSPEIVEAAYNYMSPLLFQTMQLGLHPVHINNKPFLSSLLRLQNNIVTGSGTLLPWKSLSQIIHLSMRLVQAVGTSLQNSQSTVIALPKAAAEILRSQEEDECVQLLSDAAMLLLSVATWGLLDFNFNEDGLERRIGVSEFAVNGLEVLLRFMNDDLLRVPTLRDKLFSLLKEVAQTHTGPFLNTPPQTFQKLLQATEYAILSDAPDVVRCGYQVIDSIASYCLKKDIRSPILVDFLNAIARVLVSGCTDQSVVPAVSNALFSLVGCLGVDEAGRHLLQHFIHDANLEKPFRSLEKLCRKSDFRSIRKAHKFQFCSGVEFVINEVRGSKIW